MPPRSKTVTTPVGSQGVWATWTASTAWTSRTHAVSHHSMTPRSATAAVAHHSVAPITHAAAHSKAHAPTRSHAGPVELLELFRR